MQMKCEECNHVQEAELHIKKEVTGLHHYYLQCERCFVKYTSFVTTNKVRKMIKENRKLREKQNKTIAEMTLVESNDLIIKEKMDELKDKHKY